jgi:hypothetical protein
LSLAFTGPSSRLEKPFIEDYCGKSTRHIRAVLGALFYGVFGILDAAALSS